MNNNIEIGFKLSFIGSSLATVEITFLSVKQVLCQFTLEHPFVYLLRNWCEARYDSGDLKLIEKPSKIYEITEEEIEVAAKELLTKAEPEEQPLVSLLNTHLSEYDALLEEVAEGLLAHEPELCDEGVNGTYFLKSASGNPIGVFKPIDEEIMSQDNPKTIANASEDRIQYFTGIQTGEAAYREVAAYLIDDEKFFGVPKTALVQLSPTKKKFNRAKVGSLQEFVENDGASWDIGPSAFPVDEVHKIGILDLYTLNFDRHGGNILFKEDEENGISLIPIDNGFSLPDTLAIPNLWFEWMAWSQSKKPFSQKTIEYLKRLDIAKHVEMIKKELHIRPECLRVMTVMGHLLKKAVDAGLSLYDIGCFLCPVGSDSSPLADAWPKLVACGEDEIDVVINELVSRKAN
jgi:hypothetical protein